MKENQLSHDVETSLQEPVLSDNSEAEKTKTIQENTLEDKSSDPSALILGKFKSAEDLTEAYKQLEKLQGNQSSELGALREKVASMKRDNEMFKLFENIYANKDLIQASARKYPEYFSDPSFKQIYSEAFRAFGADLDVDRLVDLVEGYASARIFA